MASVIRNGNGAEIRQRNEAVMKGIAKYAIVDPEDPLAMFKSNLRLEMDPVAPQGEMYRVVAANSPTWGSNVLVEYPTQADAIHRTILQSTLPALAVNPAVPPGVTVHYTPNVGAACVVEARMEPRGGYPVETIDRYTIDVHHQLFVPEDKQTTRTGFHSDNAADLVAWSSVASTVWTELPLFHGRHRAASYPLAGTLSTHPQLHIQFAAQDAVCMASPPAGDVFYGGLTPWVANAALFALWFLCIVVMEREADQLAEERFLIFRHFIIPRTFPTPAVPFAGTTAFTVEVQTKAPLDYLAVVYTDNTRANTQHDLFNYQGAGTNAVPLSPIVDLNVQADGSDYTATFAEGFWSEMMASQYAARVPNRFIILIPFSSNLVDQEKMSGFLASHFVNRLNINMTLQGHPTDALAGVAGNGILGAGLIHVLGVAWNVAQIKGGTFSTMYQ